MTAKPRIGNRPIGTCVFVNRYHPVLLLAVVGHLHALGTCGQIVLNFLAIWQQFPQPSVRVKPNGYEVFNILVYASISHFDLLSGRKVERFANVRLIPACDEDVQTLYAPIAHRLQRIKHVLSWPILGTFVKGVQDDIHIMKFFNQAPEIVNQRWRWG